MSPLPHILAVRKAAIAGGIDEAALRWFDSDARSVLIQDMGDRRRTRERDQLLRQAYRLFLHSDPEDDSKKQFYFRICHFQANVWPSTKGLGTPDESWSEFRRTLWLARQHAPFPGYEQVARALAE